ncbi:trimethylamine--corrinoid protein Co-methyltransferase [Alkalibaculum bacchi]|uniref:Trimethylamine--corrinoid protein Co-methyltransferase n=1 Tax=Alkalibaculum bacchi TaxID=645887 RepID=A0A366I1C4_9FIRM|nr:trimethylamine--corrinoid protein Co-methyltransferase [Alkalibaculum bacchi]
MIYGLGMLDLGMTFSYEQLIIDNEIAGMVNRVLKGVRVTDDSLAVDIINKVGPAGSFLGEKHTVKYMKTDQSRAKIFDRNMRSSWEANGSVSINDKVKKIAQEIINEHQPMPIDKDVLDQFKVIIASAEK